MARIYDENERMSNRAIPSPVQPYYLLCRRVTGLKCFFELRPAGAEQTACIIKSSSNRLHDIYIYIYMHLHRARFQISAHIRERTKCRRNRWRGLSSNSAIKQAPNLTLCASRFPCCFHVCTKSPAVCFVITKSFLLLPLATVAPVRHSSFRLCTVLLLRIVMHAVCL